MKVYRDIEDFQPGSHTVLTCGTFDGVHKGHKKILDRIVDIARSRQGDAVLLTFWPHPRIVLDPAYDLRLLSSFEEKIKLLEDAGIDQLVIVPFSRTFSNLSAEEYIKEVLVRNLATKTIVIGYDHRFGKNRAGGLEDLQRFSKDYHFEVEEISKQEIDDIVVSSTMVREHLLQGDIHVANDLLGRSYALEGVVIKGDQRGRQLGFPTANIQVNTPHKLIPADGSYAVLVSIDGILHKGMLNIGFRPTVDGDTRSIEVNIFNFDEDIYGRQIVVQFIKRIRPEMKFADLEALKEQLLTDKSVALNILSNETI